MSMEMAIALKKIKIQEEKKMKSKAEELAQLKRFLSRLEKGGYLEGIMKGMYEYAEKQIRSDMAVPVIDMWKQAEEDRSKAAQQASKEWTKAENLKVEVACKTAQLRELERKMEEKQNEYDDERNLLNDRLEEFEAELADKKETIEKLEAELEEKEEKFEDIEDAMSAERVSDKSAYTKLLEMLISQSAKAISDGDYADLRKFDVDVDEDGNVNVKIRSIQIGFVFTKSGRLIGAYNWKS